MFWLCLWQDQIVDCQVLLYDHFCAAFGLSKLAVDV